MVFKTLRSYLPAFFSTRPFSEAMDVQSKRLVPPPENKSRLSQRSLHDAPIFRLLLKVAVSGTQQCDFQIFEGRNCPNIITNKASLAIQATMQLSEAMLVHGNPNPPSSTHWFPAVFVLTKTATLAYIANMSGMSKFHLQHLLLNEFGWGISTTKKFIQFSNCHFSRCTHVH